MATVTRFVKLLLLLLVAALVPPGLHAAGGTPTDQEVKAVFVYNFSHFADWPTGAFSGDTEPFVIGVLGNDSFAGLLEDAVRGERVRDHPIQVRRLREADPGSPVHILFVDSSESSQLDRALALVKGRGTLTVSDVQGAAQRGAMIEFLTVDRRIRLRINMESTRAAGLTVNSNLLRQADIVRTASPP